MMNIDNQDVTKIATRYFSVSLAVKLLSWHTSSPEITQKIVCIVIKILCSDSVEPVE